MLDVPLEYLADDELDEVPGPAIGEREALLLDMARQLRGGADEAMYRIVNFREQVHAPTVTQSPPNTGWVGVAVQDRNQRARTYEDRPKPPPVKPGDVIAEDKLKPPRQTPGKRDDDGRRKKSG